MKRNDMITYLNKNDTLDGQINSPFQHHKNCKENSVDNMNTYMRVFKVNGKEHGFGWVSLT